MDGPVANARRRLVLYSFLGPICPRCLIALVDWQRVAHARNLQNACTVKSVAKTKARVQMERCWNECFNAISGSGPVRLLLHTLVRLQWLAWCRMVSMLQVITYSSTSYLRISISGGLGRGNLELMISWKKTHCPGNAKAMHRTKGPLSMGTW